MAVSVPMPSLPPPTSALPLLPAPKVRTNLSPLEGLSQSPTSSQNMPKLALRTPSKSLRPPTASAPYHATSASAVPTLRSISISPSQDANSISKDVRRAVSISSFPQPPKASRRAIPERGSASSIPSAKVNLSQKTPEKASTHRISAGGSRIRNSKTPAEKTSQSYTSAVSHSMLNSSGDGKSTSGVPGTRGSDGANSLLSPPQSRSSSARSSYSTSVTTFEDIDENARKEREDTEASAKDYKRQSASKGGKGNVIVSVRVRPDAAGSNENKPDGEWMIDGKRSLVAYRGRERGDYYYDNVFTAHDKNHKVYDASAKRLVRRVMEGYHGTVFAYGMTGTGKTFSMQGTTTSPGVIPLAITDIFSYIRETPHREFLLRVSYLEIYNEKINDLLSPPVVGGIGPGASQPDEIKLREDSKRGVYATPLKEEIVQSPTQLLRVIARGDHSRRTRSTQYNAQSSRSHAVVQIVVESRERASGGRGSDNKRAPLLPGGVRVSTLSMIDLAGSERAAETKERRTEGAHINKSLLTLGTVIARLSGDKDNSSNSTDKDGKHLPYRDSKLTRLLQPALSGNSLVSILCTIQTGFVGSAASANGHTGETLNTLKFAARAKNNIVSYAKRAEEALGTGVDASNRVLLERYRIEIQSLRSQLEAQSNAQHDREERQLEKEAEQRHEEQMLEMQLARTALKERIEHLNRLILSSKSTGVNSNGKLSSLNIHPKLAAYNNGSSTVSLRSPAKSLRSSGSRSTLGPLSPLNRNGSTGSTATLGGQACSAQSPNSSLEHDVEEEDSTGEFGDGTATSRAHIRALQADLADKNRYISTLEKRLLQARRSSQSRVSMAFSPSSQKLSSPAGDDLNTMILIQEKDAEIADLRAQLDDKDRMVIALRSAARKRDIAGFTPETTSPNNGKEKESHHHSNDSNDSSSSGGLVMGPFSPVDLLSPQKEKDGDQDQDKRRSLDEMSRILDEMIQDRVESGHVIRGTKGVMKPAHERRKESLSGVPGVGALSTSLRPPSTIPEVDLSS